MSVVAFNPPNHRLHLPSYSASIFSLHTMGSDSLADQRPPNATDGTHASTTLILRKLPRNTTTEVVKTMLLFSEDFNDAELVANEYPEDHGFVTAAAHFSSVAGASEAQAKLDGKPNATGKANMIVEMLSTSGSSNGRRSAIESIAPRNIIQPISPPPSQTHKASRFNDAFQSFDKLSPPPVGSPHESLASDSKSANGMFSPKQMHDGIRVTGKSVIGEDAADDETGQLLKDPLAYMKSDNSVTYGIPRQHSNPRMPIGQFSSLSLNTNMNNASTSSFTSPRSALHASTPNNAFSPGGNGFSGSGNQYLRHNYPPVNPADQNPPCNTLYVGNLPMDTSEDELKAMFSKQRGYKRLCFRTKQNGPMCFVEFEDISFATKALNELYGVQLHNSVKGGIRLSFSKNPLGVRSGQPGSNNPSTPLSPSAGMMNPMSALSPGGFTTANGPPPGLSAPPGLHMSNPISPSVQNGQFSNQAFPLGMSPLPNGRVGSMSNGSNGQHLNGGYPDYMMGR